MFGSTTWILIVGLIIKGHFAEEIADKQSNEIYMKRIDIYSDKEINVLTFESRNLDEIDNSIFKKPPPPEQGAKMARYIAHSCDWASLGTISSTLEIKGYPFSDVFSVSDGPLLNSSGVPYLYMTPLDLSTRNIEIDNRCSLSMTLAQSNYCKENNFDPEDPRCAHLVLTGRVEKVEKDSNDEQFARNALFTRHPAMKTWPKNHNWFFAKLKIEKICLLDYFGGPKYISVSDYFNVNM